jgi:hypothetical protein
LCPQTRPCPPHRGQKHGVDGSLLIQHEPEILRPVANPTTLEFTAKHQHCSM